MIMKCGHASLGNDEKGNPVCLFCLEKTIAAITPQYPKHNIDFLEKMEKVEKKS